MTHSVSSKSSGTCPHGFPGGACPFCAGMGGGSSARTRNMRRRPGEMTYNECYAIWQRMKAAKLEKDSMEKLLQAENAKAVQNSKLSSNRILNQNFMQRILNFPIIQNSINILNVIGTNIKNLINNSLKFINKLTNFIVQGFNTFVNAAKNFIIDISDKIAAIFGETKLALEENLKKFTKSIKEKFVSLFGFINKSNREEETEEIVKKEEKKIFSLSQIRRKLQLLKDRQKDADKQHSTQQEHTKI